MAEVVAADPPADAAPAAAPSSAAKVDETRIHNADQRAPIVRIVHAGLPRTLELEQKGAGSEGFCVGTSSVIWPVSMRLARHLCDRPHLVRGLQVLELGSGIGVVGAAAAGLGAQRSVLTDCETAVPLLERNRQRLAADGVGNVDVARLHWGSLEDHAGALRGTQGGYDVIVASDVVVPGFDVEKLVSTCVAMLRRTPEARIFIAYEFREEWESIGMFLHWAGEAGLDDAHMTLDEDGNEEDSDGDGEFFLYTLRWKPESLKGAPLVASPAVPPAS